MGKKKKAKNAKDLVQIEMKLEELKDLMDGDFFSAHRKGRLILLETQKVRILRQKEETWRQKNRVVWLEVGDNNTNSFQRFTNQRRITNSIWDLKDENGESFSDQSSLKGVTILNFKEI